MKKTSVSKYLFLCLLPLAFKSEADIKPGLLSYDATYQVIRNGKEMAEQKTQLQMLSNGHYLLKDQTEGTKGLASFSGFERAETSEFDAQENPWLVQQHNMQQKVTFSKRSYAFKQLPNTKQIEIQHKKDTYTISNEESPIASHMLPLRIAQLACREQQTHFQLAVLKSKKISHYRFDAEKLSNGLIKAGRLYPPESLKSSFIWLDPKRNCITTKTQYTDEDNTIETKITQFNIKAVAQ